MCSESCRETDDMLQESKTRALTHIGDEVVLVILVSMAVELRKKAQTLYLLASSFHEDLGEEHSVAPTIRALLDALDSEFDLPRKSGDSNHLKRVSHLKSQLKWARAQTAEQNTFEPGDIVLLSAKKEKDKFDERQAAVLRTLSKHMWVKVLDGPAESMEKNILKDSCRLLLKAGAKKKCRLKRFQRLPRRRPSTVTKQSAGSKKVRTTRLLRNVLADAGVLWKV